MIEPKVDDAVKESILTRILAIVDPDSCLIFLFGSMARGTATQQSDIDIGYADCHALPLTVRSAIRIALEEEVPTLHAIDFVDFMAVTDDTFRKEALEGAVEWYRGKDCTISLNSLKRRIAG